jgi:hypothetical protein
MDTRTKVTPPQLAKQWGIDPGKVLGWIRAGQLRAIDASARANGKRPRYLIDKADIATFEQQRAVVPSATPRRPAWRRRQTPGVVEFFGKDGTIKRRF